MLMWPSSTSHRRPSTESTRSVPAATSRTSVAWSMRSAIRRIRSPSRSQSSRQAPYRNSSNCRSVIPASCARASVGNWHTTHGTDIARVRPRTVVFAACASAIRSAGRSAVSRTFSGAAIDMNASAFCWISSLSGAGSRSRSSDASRIQAPPFPSHESWVIAQAPRRAICRCTSSISGRASTWALIATCQRA